MLRIKAVQPHLIKSLLDAGTGSLGDVESATALSIAERRKGRSLAAAVVAILAGDDVPAFPVALH